MKDEEQKDILIEEVLVQKSILAELEKGETK